MKITVIDGQGGGIGRQLVERIKAEIPSAEITGVGTNVSATIAMQKAGADHSATGENAVVVACRKSDLVAGPLGIVIADSLYGEITPKMALAVSQSSAVRILVPVNLCDNYVAGIAVSSMTKLVEDCVSKMKSLPAYDCSASDL